MAATKDDIRAWLETGKREGATHVIIVCDRFDWEDYPVYVKPGEDAKTIADANDNTNTQKVMECYDLSLDWDSQLNETRAHHY